MSGAIGKWSYDNEGPEQSAHLRSLIRVQSAHQRINLLFAYDKRVLSLFEQCKPASVAQSDARPTGDQEVAGSIPAGSGNIYPFRYFKIWRMKVHKDCMVNHLEV